MNKKTQNFSEELNTLIPLVRKIGIEILKIYKTDFSHEIKSDDSPVTIADHLSNKMLIDAISKFGYEIISEESENKSLTSKRTWVIDPLDGTKNFIRKTGDFAIMIGLMENYEVVLGVVYSPVLDKLYYAVKGHGSYLIENEITTRLFVNEISDLKKVRLLHGTSTFTEKEKKLAEENGITEFIKIGSVGLKLGLIAEAKAELYFFNKDTLGLWDLIAPMIILEEAGGKVFQNNAEEFNFRKIPTDFKLKNGVVATNSKLDEKIKLILKEHRA